MATTIGPVLEDQVYRVGLLALKRIIGEAELLDFPRRPNGTAILLRQSFFERLLGGELELVSFPASDVNAAQADVRNLSLAQLLHIRCANLDVGVSTPSMRSQGDFLASVDDHLEKRLASRLAAHGAIVIPSLASDVVRVVVLIYGVHEQLGNKEEKDCGHWLVRAGQLEAVLRLDDCELRDLGSLEERSAYCHRSLSKTSAAVPRCKRQLHWEVDISADPKNFESVVQRPGRKSITRKSLGRPREDSPCTGPALLDPEVAAKIKERLAEAETALETTREELETTKARLDASTTQCEELSAAKVELETAKEALLKELEVVRAELDPMKLKVQECTASEAKAVADLAATKTKIAGAKDAEAKMSLKANGLRQELSFAKQAEERHNHEMAKLREELAAAKAEGKKDDGSAQELATLKVTHGELEKELAALRLQNEELAAKAKRLQEENSAASPGEAEGESTATGASSSPCTEELLTTTPSKDQKLHEDTDGGPARKEDTSPEVKEAEVKVQN